MFTLKLGPIVFLLILLSAFSSVVGQPVENANSASAVDNVTAASILLTIPSGASVQGNPSYEPGTLTVKVG